MRLSACYAACSIACSHRSSFVLSGDRLLQDFAGFVGVFLQHFAGCVFAVRFAECLRVIYGLELLKIGVLCASCFVSFVVKSCLRPFSFVLTALNPLCGKLVVLL